MKYIDLKTALRTIKGRTILAMVLSFLIYMAGWEWPFVITVLVSMALFLPMPKVFSSWFSRLLLALLFLYALLQLAAVVQLYIYPAGKFTFMAALVLLCVAVMIGVFGDRAHSRGMRVFNFKDTAAVLACVLFIVPFLGIVRGHSSFQKIGEYGGVQVVDAVTHQTMITDYTHQQTLEADYKPGRYYPAGFHIATAFVEHGVVGDVQVVSWRAGAILYFSQYLLLGVLLCLMLVYLALGLLGGLQGGSGDRVSIMSVALAVGAGTTLMHLWLFIDTGFINFFYICAAVLAAATYLLDRPLAYDERASITTNMTAFGWPIFAFVLLGFGAAFSWPLLVPMSLVSVLLTIFPMKLRVITQQFARLIIVLAPTATIALFYALTVYVQSKYMSTNQLITMYGALGNFNILFLVVGLGVTAFVVAKNINDLGTRLLVILVPYLLLVVAIMADHFFALGEARYYLIKSSMLLEMFFLAIGAVYLVYALRLAKLNGLLRPLFAVSVVLFVILASVGTLPLPFREVRSLFRDQSGAGIPPFLKSDAQLAVDLGMHNKLTDFNMTILHYDAVGNRYFAQIQTAAWAQAFSKYGQENGDINGPSRTCFKLQTILLSQDPTTPAVQEQLVKTVRKCAAMAAHKGIPYYIITDNGSVENLQATFGNTVEIVR